MNPGDLSILGLLRHTLRNENPMPQRRRHGHDGDLLLAPAEIRTACADAFPRTSGTAAPAASPHRSKTEISK